MKFFAELLSVFALKLLCLCWLLSGMPSSISFRFFLRCWGNRADGLEKSKQNYYGGQTYNLSIWIHHHWQGGTTGIFSHNCGQTFFFYMLMSNCQLLLKKTCLFPADDGDKSLEITSGTWKVKTSLYTLYNRYNRYSPTSQHQLLYIIHFTTFHKNIWNRNHWSILV